MHNHIKIIAEAGCNHNGNFDEAVNLIKVAKDCGADAVKFQIIYYLYPFFLHYPIYHKCHEVKHQF